MDGHDTLTLALHTLVRDVARTPKRSELTDFAWSIICSLPPSKAVRRAASR
jgi:hypothetical protein